MDVKQFIKYAAVFAAGAYTQHKYTQHQVFRDTGFLALFEAALKNATQEDIDQLIYLEPEQLRDWVMAPEIIKPKLLEKFADEKQQLTFAMQQADQDEALIKADNGRKLKRLKILLPIALIGFFAGLSTLDSNTPPRCTHNPEDQSLVGNLFYLGKDRPKRESIIQEGGWICGEKEPPYKLGYYVGNAITLTSLLTALGALASTFFSPPNVREAKSRQIDRLFSLNKFD